MLSEITWDSQKEAINIKKHKVDFDEAATVFLDPFCITLFDEEHSDDEDREITVGISANSRALLVVHTVRESNVIRIISARRLTRKELRNYEEGI